MNEIIKDLEFEAVLADKGYDSDEIITSIKNAGAIAIIPPRRSRIVKREYDKVIYKERHKIENLFGFLKNYRRLFARFDKTKKNFLSFLYFVATLQWLK